MVETLNRPGPPAPVVTPEAPVAVVPPGAATEGAGSGAVAGLSVDANANKPAEQTPGSPEAAVGSPATPEANAADPNPTQQEQIADAQQVAKILELKNVERHILAVAKDGNYEAVRQAGQELHTDVLTRAKKADGTFDFKPEHATDFALALDIQIAGTEGVLEAKRNKFEISKNPKEREKLADEIKNLTEGPEGLKFLRLQREHGIVPGVDKDGKPANKEVPGAKDQPNQLVVEATKFGFKVEGNEDVFMQVEQQIKIAADKPSEFKKLMKVFKEKSAAVIGDVTPDKLTESQKQFIGAMEKIEQEITEDRKEVRSARQKRIARQTLLYSGIAAFVMVLAAEKKNKSAAGGGMMGHGG